MPNHAPQSEPVARVLSHVQGAKPNGRGWIARCPAHDDRTPSLSIAQGDDGRVLLKCYAGCTHSAIANALGLSTSDLFPATDDAARSFTNGRTVPKRFKTAQEAATAYRTTMGREAAKWRYLDASGEPIGLVLRWDREDGSKTIRPVWKIGGSWQHTYPERRPLYGLDRLAESPEARVFVAEGEKCVELLSTLGLLATTSPAGAQAAGRADWSPLAGREVVIVPDADEPGAKYAEAVRAALGTLDPAPRVAIVNLPGLAEGSGEDAVEFVARVHGGDLEAARKAIEAATAAALAAAPRKRATIVELLADPKTLAKPRTIASGWGPFDRVQPFEALEVGTVSVLAAPPGCYKTAAMLRLARGFAERGHRVEWLAGEMQPRTLVRRMVCQAAGLAQGALASGARPDEHDRRIDAARARLETLGDRLEFVGAPIGFEELERAADRSRVVFVDYLQLVRHPRPEVRGHERIEDAMAKIAECAQRTEAAFILASAQGRGSGESRTIDTATRGSSSIEFTVDALYCAKEPADRKSPAGFTVTFDCFKQREGQRLEFVVPIDGRTGLIAEEGQP